jgi:hypothetical protein
MGTIDRIHTGLIPANYVQPVRQPTTSSITLRPQTPFNATVNYNNILFFSFNLFCFVFSQLRLHPHLHLHLLLQTFLNQLFT